MLAMTPSSVRGYVRRKGVIAKSPVDHRADVFEIEIKYFKAEGFFRSEVIGEGSLRHSRSLDDVANARAAKPPLVHDTQTFGQDFFPV